MHTYLTVKDRAEGPGKPTSDKCQQTTGFLNYSNLPLDISASLESDKAALASILPEHGAQGLTVCSVDSWATQRLGLSQPAGIKECAAARLDTALWNPISWLLPTQAAQCSQKHFLIFSFGGG